MNGNFKILSVIIALGTILGGAFYYDSRVDAKIEKEAISAQTLNDVKLEHIKSELEDIKRWLIRMARSGAPRPGR